MAMYPSQLLNSSSHNAITTKSPFGLNQPPSTNPHVHYKLYITSITYPPTSMNCMPYPTTFFLIVMMRPSSTSKPSKSILESVRLDLLLIHKLIYVLVLQAMLRSPATLKLVVVTLGSKGIYYATGTSCSSISTNYLPTTIVPIVNCTGAGDSFVSGAVTGILQNQTIEKSLKMGLQAATKSVSSNFAVHPNLSIQDLSF